MSTVIRYKHNAQGMCLYPAKERKRKKKSKQGDRYLSPKEYVRICPRCGAEITKTRRLRRSDKLGIYRDVTAYICDGCGASYTKRQLIKVREGLNVRNGVKHSHKDKRSNAEYKESINTLPR